MSEKLTAAEAVYGFAGWLTSRQPPITFSSTHDAAIAAELVDEFSRANDLAPPRENFHEFLTHPR